jgi:hypothetical protein
VRLKVVAQLGSTCDFAQVERRADRGGLTSVTQGIRCLATMFDDEPSLREPAHFSRIAHHSKHVER